MAPTTHDITPIRETQNYWGLHPHENVTIGKGGRVTFRTAIGFHDIAVVTEEEWAACDVSKAEVWVNTTGDLKVDGAGDVTKEGYFYFFTYLAEDPGTYYVTCTVDAGGHCKTGQKMVLTVEDDPSDEEVTVMGSEIPFWTVGVGYSNMDIVLGDSLRFVSDSQGYHDVALLDTSVCGASNDYECCSNSTELATAVDKVLYSQSDYKAKQEYTWTPDAAGDYEVLCSVYGGLHCVFGQRFSVKVNAPTSSAVNLQGSPFLAAALLFAMLF